MFHPDAMLKIGHDRENELIRDAEACGVPKTNAAGRPHLPARALSLAATLGAVALVLAFWFGR